MPAAIDKEKLISHFTLVFEGDIRRLEQNPFGTETVFGRCVGAAMSDLIERVNDLEESLSAERADER